MKKGLEKQATTFMPKLLVFNWKMNPATLKEALSLAKISDHKNVVVDPPFIFLEEMEKMLKKADLGAQDLFWENPPVGKGAFTGEVSAKELKNIGVKYVIIGHSERRQKLGETDEIIAKKMKAAVEGGLIPILCIGETKQEKEAGKKEKILKNQLEADLLLIIKRRAKNALFIAYEPIWAIGTGKPEPPESALETIKYVKSLVVGRWSSVKVLYGGSVNSQNLGDYIKYKEIDGALVGGASLKKEEIKKIINAAKT